MKNPTNTDAQASLVLLGELIAILDSERRADGRPSLIAALKRSLAPPWTPLETAAANDPVAVLNWLEVRQPDDLHFDDLVASATPAVSGD